MNKTVKTIAWICLVLGLLGIAVDIGVNVRARSFAANIAEQIEAGDMPAMGRRFDNDEGREEDGLITQPGKGDGRFIPGSMPSQFQPATGRYRSFSFGLPLLFVTAGPVLAVVGGVMLIVNREPKQPEQEQKTKKAEKTKKE